MNPGSAQSDPADQLLAENELLRTENDVLRARLYDLERGLDELELGYLRSIAEDDAQADEIEELRQARGDIRWVTKRISKTPIAWVLRRRPGYRNLEERWLD